MKENTIPFWAQPTSKLEFHSTEAQKIKEEKIEESLGLGKKSYGTETDTETRYWFRLPIPKPGFGRTLFQSDQLISKNLIGLVSSVGLLRGLPRRLPRRLPRGPPGLS